MNRPGSYLPALVRKGIIYFDFYVDITREQFEQLCEDLFARILNIATLAVKNVHNLHHFVLVGGSSRIPKI